MTCFLHRLRALDEPRFLFGATIQGYHFSVHDWLVGYTASNIWRMWIPEIQKIGRLRLVALYHPIVKTNIRHIHISDLWVCQEHY